MMPFRVVLLFDESSIDVQSPHAILLFLLAALFRELLRGRIRMSLVLQREQEDPGHRPLAAAEQGTGR